MKPTARVVALVLGLLTVPIVAQAQPAGKIPRIGFLSAAAPTSAFAYAPAFEAFRQGLHDLGYVEGQTVVIEWRWAEGKTDRLAALAEELVRLKVDLIVTHGTAGALAAKQATTAIPIVMAWANDVVTLGLVTSLAHPDGNVTGSSWFFLEVAVKRLELLKEAMPRLTRVAVLFDPAIRGHQLALQAMVEAARTLKIALDRIEIRGSDQFEATFTALATRRIEALAVFEAPVITLNARRVAGLALKHHLPSVGFKEWPEAGGLLAYDQDIRPMARRAAAFVDKILKGAKPADLPIEQAARFDLVINLKTAKALGLTIPPAVLARADEVIQ